MVEFVLKKKSKKELLQIIITEKEMQVFLVKQAKVKKQERVLIATDQERAEDSIDGILKIVKRLTTSMKTLAKITKMDELFASSTIPDSVDFSLVNGLLLEMRKKRYKL